MPGSAGVPPTAVAETTVLPYNQVPNLDDTVACVIVEPVAANMGLVAPDDGFLAGLRAECDRVGALLIFDEVITGFRLHRGGAQGRFDVRPDLSCFGKVIGGGLNVGAFGGRADLMDHLAPLGPVYQAGTLSGNPLATAAGLAALELLDDGAYAALEADGDPAGRRSAAGVRRGRAHGPGAAGRHPRRRAPRRGRRPRLHRGPPDRRGRLRPVLPRAPRSGRRPRARSVRGPVPGPRPRRRGGRRHRRTGGRRGGAVVAGTGAGAP